MEETLYHNVVICLKVGHEMFSDGALRNVITYEKVTIDQSDRFAVFSKDGKTILVSYESIVSISIEDIV